MSTALVAYRRRGSIRTAALSFALLVAMLSGVAFASLLRS